MKSRRHFLFPLFSLPPSLPPCHPPTDLSFWPYEIIGIRRRNLMAFSSQSELSWERNWSFAWHFSASKSPIGAGGFTGGILTWSSIRTGMIIPLLAPDKWTINEEEGSQKINKKKSEEFKKKKTNHFYGCPIASLLTANRRSAPEFPLETHPQFSS